MRGAADAGQCDPLRTREQIVVGVMVLMLKMVVVMVVVIVMMMLAMVSSQGNVNARLPAAEWKMEISGSEAWAGGGLSNVGVRDCSQITIRYC